MSENIMSVVNVAIIFWLVYSIAKSDNIGADVCAIVVKILGIPFLILKFIFKSFFNKPPQVENSRFQNYWERQKVLSANHDGFVVAGKQLSLDDSTKGLILCGNTGSGKTSRFIIPNVLKLNYSQIIFDPSGEIYRATSGYKSQNSNIRVFAPDDISISSRYNPILRVKSTDLNYLTSILFDSASVSDQSSNNHGFWENGSKSFVNILLRMLKTQESRYQNIPNLRHLINSFGRDGSALDLLAVKLDPDAYAEWTGLLSQEPNVIQNFLSTAKASLQIFSDKNLAMLTGTTDNLDFGLLRKEPTCLYLVIPEHKIKYYSPLVSCLYTQLFDFLAKEDGDPVFCLLDEFSNSSKIPDFHVLATSIRKKKVAIAIILQDLDQLRLNYRESAEVIFGGACINKVFFGGGSSYTCKLIQELAGKTIVKTDKGEVSVPLISSNQARTMSGQIFIQANKDPIQISMKPYYKIKELKTMSETPPHRMEIPSGEDKIEFLPLDVSAKKY